MRSMFKQAQENYFEFYESQQNSTGEETDKLEAGLSKCKLKKKSNYIETVHNTQAIKQKLNPTLQS